MDNCIDCSLVIENFEIIKHLAYQGAICEKQFNAISCVSEFIKKIEDGDLIVTEKTSLDGNS